MALRSVLFDFTSWQAGKTQLPELFELFKGMKVDDVSRITCPMLCLVSTGEVTERIRQTQKIYGLLPHPQKALHIFTEEEGADAHRYHTELCVPMSSKCVDSFQASSLMAMGRAGGEASQKEAINTNPFSWGCFDVPLMNNLRI